MQPINRFAQDLNMSACKKIPTLSRLNLLLSLGAASTVLACSLAYAENKPAQSKPALTVSTVMPVMGDWPQHLTANGSIAAWQEAVVSAETSGLRLTEVLVNVGDRVRKGQILAKLQSNTVEADLEQTRASLAEAQATLAEAKANADRVRQIENTGALSPQQSNQYLTAELTARARVEAIRAKIKSDQIRLSQTQITAPDDGTISARSATLGAVVQPGVELFRLIRRDRLEWRAELPATDLAKIQPGMSASITTAGNNKIQGKVRMVAPTVETQTRNGLVYIDLISNGEAKAGMFARGEIEVSRAKVLIVPQSALLLRDGFSYVYRVGKDSRVIQTKVGTGARSGNQIAILSGLEMGTPLVNTGVGFLSDGDQVLLVPAKAK